MIFEMFDKLLVLSEGRQVYFGDIGSSSKTLIDYFERCGAKRCEATENPAEWLLDLLAMNSSSGVSIDWAEAWKASEERRMILSDVATLKEKLINITLTKDTVKEESSVSGINQLYLVIIRTLRHDWRSPAFLWSKVLATFIMVSEMALYISGHILISTSAIGFP
jgi:ABC-type multidrug transport system ATPase subunit